MLLDLPLLAMTPMCTIPGPDKGKGFKGGGKGVKGRVRSGPLCPYQLDIEQNPELRVLGTQSSVGFGPCW